MEFIDHNSALAPEEGVTLQDFWLLTLRLLSSFVLVYFQGWQQIVEAWHYVWDKAEWPLVEQMAESGIPMANVVAPVFAALWVIVASGLLIGFLTRIVAAIGLMLCLFVLLSDLNLSESLNIQSLILHAGLLLILTFAGGGRFSLGTLLSRKREEA
jgi:uncharacterized membrane protein YphA (DoxX/SURF4 family)